MLRLCYFNNLVSTIVIFAAAYIFCMHRLTGAASSLEDRVTAGILAQGAQAFNLCQSQAAYIRYALARGIPVANVPSKPIQAEDVTFKLFTRMNPRVPQTVRTSDSIRKSYFRVNRLTVLYSTGTNESYKDSAAIISKGLVPSLDINLIVVDWDSYEFFNQTYTRNITGPRVAKFVAQFIERLYKYGANAKQMYLIGFSTGGQIVGLASKYLNLKYPRISRLLAVDPVGACYNYLPPSQRLTSTDADFVELMHCTFGNYGVPLDYRGKVTFYMNGGIVQPPCLNQTDINEAALCSHDFSCKGYFFESLQNFNMSLGVKCDSFEQYKQKTCDCTKTAKLGFYTERSARGLYFVDTIPFSPTSNNRNCACRTRWF